MSSLGSPTPFFIAAKKAYEVERSLRFNDDDGASLTRTQSTSPTNSKKGTLSFWVKRGNLGNSQHFYNVYADNNNRGIIYFRSDVNALQIGNQSGGSFYSIIRLNRLFRDSSAWYHIVIGFDTTQGTAADRIKVYVNGSQETSFHTSNYPSQNDDIVFFNRANVKIGAAHDNQANEYFDGYATEFNYIDGFQYDPSYFGETDPITGQWNPKKYTGSYGTNGFYLNFSTDTLGTDGSGNGNNFTPNNFSVVAGAGNDAVSDSPTNNFATLNPLFMNGNETAGTFSEGNLKLVTTGYEYGTALATFSIRYGKYYWEVKQLGGSLGIHGIVRGSTPDRDVYVSYDPDGNLFGFGYQNNGSIKGTAGTGTTTNANLATGLATYTTNDIIGFASDISNGTLAIYKNNTLIYTITGINDDDWIPAISGYTSDGSYSINFGQQAFSYTPPTGYKKLNSANLPDPTILLPNQHFNTVLYSGDGNSTKSITGVGFKPDWLWLKGRNTSYSHLLYNAVVGAGVEKGLNSNENRAEGSVVGDNSTFGYLNSFDSDGFSVTKGSDSTSYTNGGSSNYVAWNWNAGDTDGKTYTVTVVDSGGNKFRFDGFATNAVTLDLAEGGTYIFNYPSGHPFRFSTTSDGTHGGGSEYTTGVTHNSSTQVTIVVAASAPTLYYYCSSHSGMGGQVNTNSTLGSSNFDGTIQSTVKVNASAGFSIVSFTGNATSGATVGHGLGVAPRSFILKERGNTNNWPVYHAEIGNTKVLYLDLNNDSGGAFTGAWNNTSPTSNVFYLGNSNETNRSSGNFIVYCFSEVAGFSKFGTFTGNGNADGTFVYTGFKPAMLIMKASSGTSNWTILDNKRDPHNVTTNRLQPNLSNAEDTPVPVDFLSNGFKHRSTNLNSSGDTHIYMAFAESPFKYARAR